MADRSYWLDLFTAVTWQAFVAAGANVSGFRESRWNTLQKVKVDDYFFCYRELRSRERSPVFGASPCQRTA